jgi:50S ribosomal protein L16 3-hydroxylase
MDSDFTLPRSFWDGFVREFWDKDQPTLIRQPFKKPLATLAEVFDILASSAADYTGLARKTMNVYVDNGLHDGDARYFLPRHEDGSLRQFAERLKSEIGNKPYTLVTYGGQFYSAPVWMRVRDFLQGLFEEVGLPIGHSDLDMFFGCYKSTPTGIHQDTAATFSYIVEGPKKMLFWPAETFAEQARTMYQYLGTNEYERYLDRATSIEAQTGDIIFWPASYWHMAISDGGWPTTVNMSVHFLPSPFFFLRDAIENRTLIKNLPGSKISHSFPFSAEAEPDDADVPECLLREVDLIRAIGQMPDLFSLLKEAWLKRLTASGFNTLPRPRARVSLADDDVILGHARYPVRLMQTNNGSKVIANGRTFEAPRGQEVERAVEMINSAEGTAVRDVLKVVPGLENQKAVRNLLEELYCVWALERA